MAEITEVFDDIKDAVGDKGFLILVVGAVAFGLYNLMKPEQSTGETLTTVTTVSSYPDAITNANVIIDTLQNSIDYSQQEIQSDIQGLGDDLTQYLSDNFEATNDYINTGFESQKHLLEENFDDIQGGLDKANSGIDKANSGIKTIKQSVNGIKDIVGSISGSVSSLSGSVSSLSSAVDSMKKSYNSSGSSGSATASTTASSNYLQYQTKAGLNTNTSIVDALKAIGVDSSMSNRANIASKNGISNYSGTYQQNVTLLNMLKAGQLKG